MDTQDVFNVELFELNNNNNFHFITIEEVTENLKQIIDNEIVGICENDEEFTIDNVKKDLEKFFLNKDENTKMGAIAEFIVHLYLRTIGFNQECLYRNLEEGSIKKGFDGYYTLLSEEWIMESKSGSITTESISHKRKLNEAYSGLTAMLAGKTSNNPWKNALNHAKVVGSKQELIDNIRKLTIMYGNNEYPKIKDLNIIPSSTIYHKDIIHRNEDEVKVISDFANTLEAKKMNIICVNKRSIEKIINCLTS